MNRGQLTDQLADRTGLPRSKADALIRALFDPKGGVIAEELRAGGSVELHGFGLFSARARAGRKGTHPRTGREIDIPTRRVCVFTPRKGLRSSMKDMVGA